MMISSDDIQKTQTCVSICRLIPSSALLGSALQANWKTEMHVDDRPQRSTQHHSTSPLATRRSFSLRERCLQHEAGVTWNSSSSAFMRRPQPRQRNKRKRKSARGLSEAHASRDTTSPKWRTSPGWRGKLNSWPSASRTDSCLLDACRKQS